MNPFDPDLFAVGTPCLPCCGGSGECACALFIPPGSGLVPPFGSPYASYADAATAITNQTSGCIGYCNFQTSDTGQLFSASFDGTTITAAATAGATVATELLAVDTYFLVTLSAGGTISIPFIVSTGGGIGTQEIDCYLLACEDFSEVDYQFSVSGTGTVVLTAPSAGTYILEVRGNTEAFIDPITSVSLSFTATCSVSYTVSPVIALYDDSGTTRQLEACPKMLFPLRTESTGDWFASCADAATEITDKTSNCVGYCGDAPGNTFLATGGASFNFSLSGLFLVIGIFEGSASAEVGETFTLTGSGGTGVNTVGLTIYDYAGVLVETVSTSGTGTVTSSPLPYTGRYHLVMAITPATIPDSIFTASLSSSGTMSTNAIQALYDSSLSCPSRLNCGDSC